MDKKMMRALQADGEKLRHLTGQDHGPEFWDTCPACDGEGAIGYRITVYEPGCGFPHDDVEEKPCQDCGGSGWVQVA